MNSRGKSKSVKALEKGTNKMPKTDSKAVIWVRDRLYPLLIILSKPKIKYDIVPLNCPKVLPGMSVIFAGNHFHT